MLKGISFIAAALIAVGIAAAAFASQPSAASDDQDRGEIIMRVEPSILSGKSETLTLTVTNDSAYTASFGSSYTLEVLDGGVWRRIPYITIPGVYVGISTKLLHLLPPGDVFTQPINLGIWDNDFSDGLYRATREINGAPAFAYFSAVIE